VSREEARPKSSDRRQDAGTVIDLNNGVKREPHTPGTAGNDQKARG
jgi:hypothetical protein